MSTGIFYTLGLNASPLLSGLGLAKNAVGGFLGIATKIGALGIAGGLGLAAGAAVGFSKAINEAADMETMSTSFEVLLGSADAAAKRMGELAKFAAATPFELPEISSASRALETLTKGALSTGAGLTLVGDVAAGTNQPFGELAVTIGRLYDGLQSGRPVGEAMQRLQELGAISGETRGEIEALQKEGKKGDAVWQTAASALSRFGGMMDKQSGTWNGLMSTLKDGITGVFREFGTPVMFALKPMLTEGIGLADRLATAARSAGEGLATGISFFYDAFKSGNLGEVAGLSIRAGFSIATDWLTEKLSSIFSKIGEQAPKLFAGIATLFEGIGTQLGLKIKEAITGISQDDRIAKNQQMLGIKQIGHALGGPGKGLFDGLAKDGASAKAALASAFEKFETQQQWAKFNALTEAQNKQFARPISGPATESLGESSPASSRGAALSDRLSKIGLLIGGSSPSRQAAENTARNTAKMVTQNEQMLAALVAKPAGATF